MNAGISSGVDGLRVGTFYEEALVINPPPPFLENLCYNNGRQHFMCTKCSSEKVFIKMFCQVSSQICVKLSKDCFELILFGYFYCTQFSKC